MRLRVPAVATGVLLAVVSCSTDPAAGRISAVVSGEPIPSADPDEVDRWFVEVDLVDATVGGVSGVVVGFYGDELSCPVDQLDGGVELEFTRVGRDVIASDPPVISGTDLDMECEGSDGS